MRNLRKRTLSLLLAFIMAFSMLPATAWAADTPSPISKEVWEKNYYTPSILSEEGWVFRTAYTMRNCDLAYARYEKSVYNPEAGGDSYEYAYVIALDKTAGVEGNYAIPDYENDTSAPWSGDDTMSAVYIESGVTAIGDYAFTNKNLLETVEIPDTVTRIGERAFSGDIELRASADGKTPLDLSHVTEFGAYAFYDCNALGGSGGVTLNTTSTEFTEIPDGLFTATYLTTIELNDHITRIGESAFAHCSLSGMITIDLPESLVTIGDYAFNRQTDSPQITITSLTIPEHVTTIGQYAFYNFQALQTVTVEAKNLSKPGEAAFGDSENNAYSRPGEIELSDGTKVQGMVGTTFLMPDGVDENYIEMFDNGFNCYLGDQSPLKLVKTEKPTCEQRGYREYSFEWKNVAVEEHYFAYIDPVGHNYVFDHQTDPTCTQPAYDVYCCTNLDNGLVRDCEAPYTQEAVEGSQRLGHNYQLTDISSNQVNETTEATFTFTCQNYSANPEQNHHDDDRNNPWQLTATVPAQSLQANTAQTLNDIANQLPSGNTYKLSWNEEEETLGAYLTAGEHYYDFTLTPNSSRVPTDPISEWKDEPLTIQVDVARAELDFSNVRIENNLAYVDTTNSDPQNATVTGAPEKVGNRDTNVTCTLQYTDETDYDKATPPDRDKTWNGTVTATFSYDASIFHVDEEKAPAGYTFDVKEEGDQGTVTISTDYIISARVIDAQAQPISGLTYSGNPQNTLMLNGVPYESTIEISWTDDKGESGTFDLITSPSEQTSVSVAPFTEAGTYTLDITISKTDYTLDTLENVQVTIGKKPVSPPSAGSYTYDQIQHTGFTVAENAPYAITENTAADNTKKDAGTYQVAFQLNDTANYVWADGTDSDGDGKITLPWTISPKQVPNLYSLTSDLNYTYDSATPRTVVTYAPEEPGYDSVYDDDTGTLTVTWKNETVFTVTDARQTNAGNYTCTGQLAESGNFRWMNTEATEVTLGTWTISKKQITPTDMPTLTVPSAPYDGSPYDGDITVQYPDSTREILSLDEGTPYFYYSAQTGGQPLSSAPTNAGNYYVEPNWVYDQTNYSILSNPRTLLQITRVQLTSNEVDDYTLPYTGQPQTVKSFTVSGLVNGENESVYSITYTLKTWDTEAEDWAAESSAYEPGVLPTVTNIGKYQVSATLSADNYTATFTPYEVTIGTGTQTITLTPADADKGGWNDEDSDGTYTMTVTLGETPSFTVTGKGAVDPEATITYAVTNGDAISIADNSKPEVTVNKAGTATVTVTAAATGKVGDASVTYNVTVNKGTPVINRADISATYDGQPLEKSDYEATLSAPADSGAPKPTGQPTYAFFKDADCTQAFTDAGNNNIPSAQGEYYLKISYAGDNNYNANSKIVKVTISAAALSVTPSDYEGTYDGTSHNLAGQVTVKGLGGAEMSAGNDYTIVFVKGETAPADWDTATKATAFKDVADSGTYQYRVTAQNYGTITGSITVTVEPKDLTVTHSITDKEKVYDGTTDVDSSNSPLTTIVKDGDSSTDAVTVAVGGVTAAYNSENVAEANQITVTVTLNPEGGETLNNYTFNGTNADSAGKITLTVSNAKITKKTITVTGGITATNKVYDGDKEIALTGTPMTKDFIENDDVKFSAISNQTGMVDDYNAGDGKEVTVTAATLNGLLTGADAGNYTVSADYKGATVDITPRPVYLLFPNQTQGTEWSIDVPYSTGGLTSQHGVYQVSAKEADNVSGFVGDDSLADSDITYSFTDSEDDSVTNPTNLGTYTVTAQLTDDAKTKFSNYSIAAITGTIEITQNTDELSVTITPNTGLTYNGEGQDPIQSIAVKGGSETLQENAGYTIGYSLDNDGTYDLNHADLTDAIKDAGSYTVYWKVTTTNYGEKTGSFEVTVERATLTLSRDVEVTRAYDGTKDAADQVTNVQLTGQQNSENISVTGTSAAYDAATVDASKITITYTLTAADGVLDNYKVSINNAAAVDAAASMTEDVTATITKAPVTVTISNQTAVYDGAKPEVAQERGTSADEPKNWYVSAGEVYQLNGSTDDDLGITLSIPSDAKDVKTYAITGTAGNKNYDVTFVDGEFEVTPRNVQVTIGDKSGVYGDVPNVTAGAGNVTLTDKSTDEGEGIVTGENIYDVLTGLELTTTATKESPITDEEHSYSISETNGVYGNYNVTFTNGTYTVNRRPITITIADKNSDYGCETVQLTHQVTYTGDNSGKTAIVNNDDVVINLSTDASDTSNVGTYAITAEVTGADNYEVTKSGSWNGSDDNQGKAGTYTINKADLTIAFPNQSVNVSMGNSVNNPLEFTNASNNNEKLTDKPEDVTVEYMSDKPDVAKVDKETGAVTIVGPGDAAITAKVTDGGKNFNGGDTATYEIHVAGASTGIQVQATPENNLVYNGAMQQLLSDYIVTPSNATVTFAVETKETGDRCEIDETTKMPMAQDAGTYRVSWTATLAGYSKVTGWVDVTIDKANPSTGFSSTTVQTTYEEGKIFDSTTSTMLNTASGYTGNITYKSDNTQVAKVNDNDLAKISINATGNATISATFAKTDNYKAQTVSFTLEVVDSETAIQYSAANYEVTYDGKPRGAKITVNSPSTYTIMYSENNGTSYDLEESPTITDVNKSPLTIHYQISAPGYSTVDGTQTVTVKPKAIDDDMVSGVAASYTYTGEQITTPTLTVADGSTLLVKDKDYKVEYGANTEVGAQSGSVRITGMGNYDGSITKYFNISAVDASYLTASLDRYYGTYGDSETNNANVTVKFGDNELTVGQDYQIACDTAATIVDNKLTFTTVGTHTITVTGTGNYDGEVTLTYTLLPAASEHGLNLTAGGQVTPYITTYGETVDGSIVVADPSDHSKVLDPRHYDLTYVYYDNLGSQPTSSATYTEDILEKGTPQAGMYVVTATAKGSYSGTGSFVFLILKRDLADTDISAQIDGNPVYSGQAQQPTVSLSYNGDAITDLAATQYLNNVNAGQAQAVSTADGTNNNFTGTRVDKFTIDKKSIATGFDAKADPKAYDYTGKVIVPTVTVTDTVTSATLNRNTDFTVTASGQEPGNYQATVKGIGNYTSEMQVEYTILSNPIQPVTGLELTVTPDKWTYTATPSVTIGVTHDGNSITDYTLTVEKDGTALVTNGKADEAIAVLVNPGAYTITANGAGVYAGSSDTATVTISKIKPEVTATATPASLSGGGKVTLTLRGSNLPADTDLTSLLKVTAANGTAVDLTKLNWTENTDGSDTAELTLTNANETYTFTLAFTGNDFYDAASDTAMVVTAQHTSSGGGGGGGGGTTTPPAEETDSDISTPNDTGVSEWLITSEHIQYLSGYGDGLFGPTDNMTRAQTAQMFYNLLKDKDVPVTVTFDDVPADAWYAESVGTLASLGIINGVADGYYAPDRAITRAEFTAIAMRFAQVDTSGADIFPDVNEDDWFYEMVVSAVNYGWVNGYADGTFRPNATITRAEVAAIVNRMLGRSADEAYVDAHSDELTQFTDVSPYYWAYYNIMEAANPHEYTQKDGTEVWKD